MLKFNSKFGFSLIELMVVTAIMLILASAFVINLTSQRASRDIRIAQNELVSNIRKTQSYTLSSRLLSNGQSAQYYLLKFDLTKPTEYKIQALYNVSSSPTLTDVETIKLPPNIEIATTSASSLAIYISRPINPSPQPSYLNCTLLAFAAPYGKVIFNDGCTTNPANPAMPFSLSLSDDYWSKIINFQNNIPCDGGNDGVPPASPSACTASTDSVMTITLADKSRKLFKTVNINAITGAVTFN